MKTRSSKQAETALTAPKPKLTLGERLRGYFLAGVLVTAPIGVTLYLGWLFVTFVDEQVGRLLPRAYNPETYLPFSVPGLGVLIAIGALILIGAFAAGFVGRTLLRMSETIMAQLPVIRNVYGAIKQILEAVIQSQHNAFREVVMLEYPRKGLWSIGFVTGSSKGEVQNITASEMINVFVPTTPNPTSGYLLFVPREDAIKLHMSVEDAIKLVVSGGIVTPPDQRPPEEKLSDEGSVDTSAKAETPRTTEAPSGSRPD